MKNYSDNQLIVTGPLAVLDRAQHKKGDPKSKAFSCAFVGAAEQTVASEGCSFKAHMDYKTAYNRLRDVDVLVVPGGSTAEILKSSAEPIGLIKAFGELQKNNPERERTLLSVCTGSLFLAKAGVLQGLSATTHHDYDITLEKLCQEASAHVSTERTDVLQERYVVNNGRFDLGDLDENPFVIDKREIILSHKERRRSSVARKGSNSWKESNKSEHNLARRATLRLGGLRVITSGPVTAGIDAALYLVCAMVSQEAAEDIARTLGYTWVKGVVVNALDV